MFVVGFQKVLVTKVKILRTGDTDSFVCADSNTDTKTDRNVQIGKRKKKFLVSCVRCHMSRVTFYVSCVMCHVSHVTC